MTIKLCKQAFTLVGLALMLAAGQAQGAVLSVAELRCESRIDPLDIDVARPRLSWQLDSKERGQVQTAYRVLVATSPELLMEGKADLWDSGKVLSSQSIQVPYEGKPLTARQRVFWEVRAWNKQGEPSAYSRPASWEMGLLHAKDWQGAVWIERQRARPLSEAEMFEDDPAPLLRKEFVLAKPVRRARVYVSGLGYYELHLNGQRVGDRVLDPGWTSYAQRVLYSTCEVTDQLKRGTNALGAMLGNGWFNPLPLRLWGHINPREHLTTGEPRLILLLVVDYNDGSTQSVVTDPTWKATDGPILRNSVYLGKVYDARRELPGWDQAGFADARWESVVSSAGPLGPLRAQDAPAIKITRTLQPVAVTEPKPGVYIFDLGQNFAGWTRLRVKGTAGTRVRLRSGELLYPDGTLNGMTAVCGQIKGGGPGYCYPGTGAPKTAWQQDEYVLHGAGEETYTPRFTFHGFRYVEVTVATGRLALARAALPKGSGRPAQIAADSSVPAAATILSLEGLRLNADVAPSGEFSCSNERLNRIQRMVLWTELSNLFSVESDCPHREKFGYGGDIVAASEMAIFNFDMSRFYAKAVEDLAEAVRPNGGFTETAPFVGIADQGLGDKSGPVGWGTAHPWLLWQLYQYYGNRRLLEEQYDGTKRWIALLKTRAQDGILDNGISDHESLVPKPRALTGTAFYYFNVKLFGQIARALGHNADAAEAETLAQNIRDAFNQKFLQSEGGRYDTGSQACQAFALYMGLVPGQARGRVLEVLTEDILEDHQGHLTTGIFGTKYLLNALTDAGRADVAYNLANQHTFPSWGYMLERGATTLWEHWDFSDNTYSHNHPMFGSVSEWFYKALAGINPAPEAVGFDRIRFRPQPVGDLTWVKSRYNSVHGPIVSEWRREGERFVLHVRVPVGATATVELPASTPAEITEGGKPLARAKDVRFLAAESGRAVLAIGSGDYRFASARP